MYLITGVTGNTGRVVAEQLLSKGEKVRVLVRDAAKGESWKARGAEVAVGSLEDAQALATALVGVQGAYLIIPPDARATDALARGARFVATFKAALEQQPVAHVVYLSSIAAQLRSGTGPVVMHFHGEAELRQLKTPVTFVRASYFMENLLAFTTPLTTAGVLPALFDPERSMDMVATVDIGHTAADSLLGPTPAKHEVIELSGPTSYTLQDAAAAFGATLHRDITISRVPAEAVTGTLVQAGIGANMAGLYSEMSAALTAGVFQFEGGAAKRVHGSTTLQAFVEAALASRRSQNQPA